MFNYENSRISLQHNVTSCRQLCADDIGYVLWNVKRKYQGRTHDFPSGAAELRQPPTGHISAKMYVKMKELGPVGWGERLTMKTVFIYV